MTNLTPEADSQLLQPNSPHATLPMTFICRELQHQQTSLCIPANTQIPTYWRSPLFHQSPQLLLILEDLQKPRLPQNAGFIHELVVNQQQIQMVVAFHNVIMVLKAKQIHKQSHISITKLTRNDS